MGPTNNRKVLPQFGRRRMMMMNRLLLQSNHRRGVMVDRLLLFLRRRPHSARKCDAPPLLRSIYCFAITVLIDYICIYPAHVPSIPSRNKKKKKKKTNETERNETQNKTKNKILTKKIMPEM